jgi:transcriptional regulator with XRE-family HTH domain
LIGDQSRAAVARNAAVPATVITTYINRGSEPSARNALHLARALNVPTDWLIDDERGWPPPSPNAAHDATDLTDHDLLHELAKRYRRASMEFQDAARRAKTIDWAKVADQAEATPADKPLPGKARRAKFAIESLQVKFGRAMQDFDVFFYSCTHHDELPGADRPVETFDTATQSFLWGQFEDSKEFRRFVLAVKNRPWTSSELKSEDDGLQSAGRKYADVVSLLGMPLQKWMEDALK